MPPETIKEVCDLYGLNQSDLVSRYGIPRRTVQDWFSGRRKPADYIVKLLADALKNDKQESEK